MTLSVVGRILFRKNALIRPFQIGRQITHQELALLLALELDGDLGLFSGPLGREDRAVAVFWVVELLTDGWLLLAPPLPPKPPYPEGNAPAVADGRGGGRIKRSSAPERKVGTSWLKSSDENPRLGRPELGLPLKGTCPAPAALQSGSVLELDELLGDLGKKIAKGRRSWCCPKSGA